MCENPSQLAYFDTKLFFDEVAPYESQSFHESCHWEHQEKITPQKWLQDIIDAKIRNFSATPALFIDFNFLQEKRLRFLNGAIYEDALFGTITFLQADSILVIPQKFYTYRIRPNSTCGYIKTISDKADIQRKQNLVAKSWALIALHTLEFLQNFEDKELAQSFEKAFMPFYAKQFLLLFDCKADPLNLRPNFSLLLPYLENIPLSFYERILAFHPLLRPIAVKIHHFYLWQKDLERRFRRWRKGRKIKCKLGKAAK